MTWPSSLSGRVALVTSLVGALAALLAAVVSWQIASELVDRAEVRRLRVSAEIFMNELILREPSVSVEQAVAEELVELAPASIRIAVYEQGRHVGGDALPLPVGECIETKRPGLVQHACASVRGSTTVVAASSRGTGVSSEFALGSVVASALAALAAAAAGRKAAGWAISPLNQLTQSLDFIRAQEPDASALPDPGKVREVVALREALSALVGRLSESIARARRFSADAAHELRTPLTVLSAQLELLLEETSAGEGRSDLLLLQLRVQSLARLVERLLVLATSEQGSVPRGEPVALEDVARHCVNALPEREQLRVTLECDAQGMTGGDEALLRVLVDNALDNALKFSGAGPVTLRISESAGRIALDVTDDGPGLGEAERRRAFDAFFRSPGARAKGLAGHGIGLALVAQVSRQHGGSCAFLDAAKGAHLRVSLPAWRPSSDHPRGHG
ncbi:MAG: HAMP domain-containing sensor histidine kinase [Polyangiaceae bacterium]